MQNIFASLALPVWWTFFFCVFLLAIENSLTGAVYVSWYSSLPKVSAAAIAQGEKIILDLSTGGFEDDQATPAAGYITNGAVATEAAGNGVTTVKVRLVPCVGVAN